MRHVKASLLRPNSAKVHGGGEVRGAKNAADRDSIVQKISKDSPFNSFVLNF